jgi:NADH:ubiquinone oxidoreductase subunit B-like Fe-S oxidoreductase
MYNVENGVDKFIPVDVYVPGCAARPENIIDGVVRALEILEKKKKDLQLTRKCVGDIEYVLGKQLNRRKIVAEGIRRCYEGRRD